MYNLRKSVKKVKFEETGWGNLSIWDSVFYSTQVKARHLIHTQNTQRRKHLQILQQWTPENNGIVITSMINKQTSITLVTSKITSIDWYISARNFDSSIACAGLLLKQKNNLFFADLNPIDYKWNKHTATNLTSDNFVLVNTLLTASASSSEHPNFEEGELVFGLIVSNTTDASTECMSGVAEWCIDINTEEVDEKGKRPVPDSISFTVLPNEVDTVKEKNLNVNMMSKEDAMKIVQQLKNLEKASLEHNVSLKRHEDNSCLQSVENKIQEENTDKLLVKVDLLSDSVQSIANAKKKASVIKSGTEVAASNSQSAVDQKLDKILAAISSLEMKQANNSSAELSVLVNQTLQKLRPEEKSQEKLVKQELFDAAKLKIEKLEKQAQTEIELRKKVEEELLLEKMVKERIVRELREEREKRLTLEEELEAEKKACKKAEEEFFDEFEKRNNLAKQLIAVEHEASLHSLTASWRKVD